MAWQSVAIASFSSMLIVEYQGGKSKNMNLKFWVLNREHVPSLKRAITPARWTSAVGGFISSRQQSQ